MTTGDDLTYFTDTELIEISLESAPDVADKHGEHEVQFLHVKTGKGSFTVETHNEHNGYYGGFRVEAKLKKFKTKQGRKQ